jgi:hypothetical protein
MTLDGKYWAPYFRRVFCREVQLLHETLQVRLLPNFKNIDQEAEEISRKEYQRIGSMPGGEHFDMANAAEYAQEMGLNHYEQMTAIRQGLLNLFVIGYRHIFDQQILTFHRRQVLHPMEEDDIKLINIQEFIKRLDITSIDVRSFSSWDKLLELELVSNVIKHAEGRSAELLRNLRPDLFLPITSFKFDIKFVGRVFKPLAGQDLYLNESDLEDYKNAICSFWEEFADNISN